MKIKSNWHNVIKRNYSVDDYGIKTHSATCSCGAKYWDCDKEECEIKICTHLMSHQFGININDLKKNLNEILEQLEGRLLEENK